MSTVAELKEEWREENWEREINGIARVTWTTFSLRPSVWRRAGHSNGANNAHNTEGTS